MSGDTNNGALQAKGVSETYQYIVGRSSFHFTVDDGSIELHDGQARNPAATLITDEQTWADIAAGEITPSSAIATGALTLTGEPQAANRLKTISSRNRVLARAEATIKDARRRG